MVGIMSKESRELKKKKKELNSLIEDYFALSKKDITKKDELMVVIQKLEQEVQSLYQKIKEK